MTKTSGLLPPKTAQFSQYADGICLTCDCAEILNQNSINLHHIRPCK